MSVDAVRVPAGVRSGGQFAAADGARSRIALEEHRAAAAASLDTLVPASRFVRDDSRARAIEEEWVAAARKSCALPSETLTLDRFLEDDDARRAAVDIIERARRTGRRPAQAALDLGYSIESVDRRDLQVGDIAFAETRNGSAVESDLYVVMESPREHAYFRVMSSHGAEQWDAPVIPSMVFLGPTYDRGACQSTRLGRLVRGDE